MGLLFTKRPREEVLKYFDTLSVADYAPPGFVHSETIVLPAGELGAWPVSMMDQFRKLGVVVEVEDGLLLNRHELNMCTAGEPITPEGAKLLVRPTAVLLVGACLRRRDYSGDGGDTNVAAFGGPERTVARVTAYPHAPTIPVQAQSRCFGLRTDE